MRKEKKVGIPTLYISICVVLLYFIWPYFVNAILAVLGVKGDAILYSSLSANFLLMFLIIGIYFQGVKADLINYKKNFKKLFFKGGKIFVIGIIIYMIVSVIIVELFPNASNESVDSLLHIYDKSPFLLLISTLFYFPIVEELVFKKTFKNFISNKWVFVIVTAFMNGIFEVVFSYSDITGIINVLPLIVFYGMLSYIYYETDNITVSISYRMIFNLIPCIGALLNVALILL